MRDDSVDPRDTEWECDNPAYRVYFWRQQTPPPGIPPEQMGWESHEHRLTDVTDVHQVIAWAEERLPTHERYVLYVEQSDAGSPGLVRLAGVGPTEGEPLVVQ
ncbi:MAG: hypothetical protein ACTHOK_16475 [Nocardioidaceae bacterium]